MYEQAAGKFFFSASLFRGIRDDIEEEDEQVSENYCTVNSLILLPHRRSPSFSGISAGWIDLNLFVLICHRVNMVFCA